MKAVIFDMDGVLFDTERLCKDCWCEVAAEKGLQGMDEVFPKCIGTNNADTRRIVMDYYGEDFPYEAFSEEASVLFHQYVEQNGMPMKVGVRELLDYLKKENYQIALASSTRRASVEKCLRLAGIEGYFDTLTTGDMVLHSKPEPEIYLIACESLDLAPQECYAIEDSYNGIRSAYSAGMKAIMVPDLIPPDEEMQEKAEVILDTLLDVIQYLGEQ